MRAILIDPFDQTVTEVDYSGDFKQIHELLNIRSFTLVSDFAGGNDIYVDDNGLAVDFENQAFFIAKGYPEPLAGKGLILGVTPDGESTATELNLEDARQKIRFIDHATLIKEFS